MSSRTSDASTQTEQCVVDDKKIPACQHEWVRIPRLMNEHTTYECSICGIEDGFA